MLRAKITGIDALIKGLDDKSKNYSKNVQSALNAWADDVATNAITLVSQQSSNEGNLKNSIRPEYGQMKASVKASASYAAYIEFGTRKYASQYVATLPNEWKDLANQFKGPGGGTFKQFIESLKEWARKKGVPEDKVYPIAKKIMIEGIRPKPFLYPSVNKYRKQLSDDIKNALK